MWSVKCDRLSSTKQLLSFCFATCFYISLIFQLTIVSGLFDCLFAHTQVQEVGLLANPEKEVGLFFMFSQHKMGQCDPNTVPECKPPYLRPQGLHNFFSTTSHTYDYAH